MKSPLPRAAIWRAAACVLSGCVDLRLRDGPFGRRHAPKSAGRTRSDLGLQKFRGSNPQDPGNSDAIGLDHAHEGKQSGREVNAIDQGDTI